MGTFIIAEAGVNHNGSLELAKKLVDAASEAQCDAVKFQTFKANKLVSVNAQKAEYQKETTGDDESQLEMIRKLELSQEDHLALKAYCEEKGILFLSSAFDEESLAFLESIDMPLYKVPSGEITNLRLLKQIGSYHKRVIMSCGMSEMEEIKKAYDVLMESGAKEVDILHCNTQYPTPFEDVNLRVMKTLKDTFHTHIGYSDHTVGIEVPLAAVALGAEIIEKHFTLDKTMEGPDHRASLDPNELKAMVRGIRNIEKALGSSEKHVSASERANRDVARKSLVASCSIAEGEVFTESNLTMKRPGNGIDCSKYEELIGKKAKHTYVSDELIQNDEIE